jgi:hypothetical protein
MIGASVFLNKEKVRGCEYAPPAESGVEEEWTGLAWGTDYYYNMYRYTVQYTHNQLTIERQ